MPTARVDIFPLATIDVGGLDALLAELARRDLRVVGPTIRDRAIVHDDIASVADLPRGWTEEQDGGSYRLVRRDDDALFGYAVGPHSWKQYLFPARTKLWEATREEEGFAIAPPPPDNRALALVGARACDLRAIGVQDTVFRDGVFRDGVFRDGAYVDPLYAARREGAVIIAVNCSDPGGTCFCVSMGTGPRARAGFDLALTELLDGGRHEFLVEVGSERGASLLHAVSHRPADRAREEAAAQVVEIASSRMGRTLGTTGIRELLASTLDHPRWDEVAERCLACANCTMVCPTCFCSTVEDTTDLTGDHAERWRSWDSCFTLDHSYLHGGSVRTSTRSRYRQWLTHKLGTWWDQFGESGCVGCGRCISWCPVAIDVTEEVAALADDPQGVPVVLAGRPR